MELPCWLYYTAKASKKLYALRLFKRAGVQEQDMLKVALQFAIVQWSIVAGQRNYTFQQTRAPMS